MNKEKSKWAYLERPIRYFYLRFIRLRCSDIEVAKGIALGVFIGMTPTMGIQIPLALFFAVLLKENKLAAMLGVFVTNPVTVVPIYSFNFIVGKYILGTSSLAMPRFTSAYEVLNFGHNLLVPLIFGSCIVGVISAAIAYMVALRVFRIVRPCP